MNEIETDAQSFIVKIWVEEKSEQKSWGVWHGHIIHVASGEKRYFGDPNEIRDFIASHLKEMGVKVERRSLVARWFKHLLQQS